MIDIDAMAAESLARMTAKADERFAAAVEQSKREHHFIQRSLAQKFRRLREQMIRELQEHKVHFGGDSSVQPLRFADFDA